MIRYLLTLLILFLSTFSNAETATSPFVYEIIPNNGIEYCIINAKYDKHACSYTKEIACSSTIDSSRQYSSVEDFFGEKCLHYNLDDNNNKKDVNALNFTQREVDNSCPSDSKQSHLFPDTVPTSSVKYCADGCEYLPDSVDGGTCTDTVLNKEVDCIRFNSTTTSSACRLKSFDKPDAECPDGQIPNHENVCSEVVCPPNTTFDNSSKTCKINNPDNNNDDNSGGDNPDDQPNNSDDTNPDNPSEEPEKCLNVVTGQMDTCDSEDPTTCPTGYKYNKSTDECLRDTTVPTDCSQQEKDANGGQCKSNDSDVPPNQEPPKPSQCTEYNSDGTCKEREGNITCKSFKPFCEFRDWIQGNGDEIPTDEDGTAPIKDFSNFDYESKFNTSYFTVSGSAQCPAPVQIPLSMNGTHNLEISYSPICKFSLLIQAAVLLFFSVIAFKVFSKE